MKDTQNFMLLFRYEPNNNYQPTADDLAEQQRQWGGFIGNLAVNEKLVSTHQLGFNGKQINNNLVVSEGINLAEGKTLGGNMIVRANSIDEAVELAQDCPILKVGGTVEVRDIVPM